MSNFATIATMLHAVAAVIWVGGMFFAYVVLRPATGALEPPAPLKLWVAVLPRFFPWVWASVIILLLTGYAMVFGAFGGFANAGYHVQVMHGSGLFMMVLFVYLFFVPYPRFLRAVQAEEWTRAAVNMGRIRRVVAINLTIGLLNVVVGGSGRFWP